MPLPPATLASRLLSPFHEFGLVAGALYLADRLLRRLSPQLGLYVYELMVQPITDKPLLPASLTKHVEFREIRPGDPELECMPVPHAIRESRYRQHAVCLGTFHKGMFTGYIWFCRNAYAEDEVRCTFLLPADDTAVFDFDLYVVPEKRMGIGFMAIWHGASQYLYQRGVRYTFSRLTRFNIASRRSHAHLGWKRVGSAIFLRLWRLEFMCATVTPFVSITLNDSQRTKLLLRPDVLLQTQGRTTAV